MTMRSLFRTIVAVVNVTLVVAPILTLFLGTAPLNAQNPAPEYTFVVASGFVCESGNCPAAAKSVNGDTYEITGAGTFNAQTKSVSAAGTFTHKIPNGTVIESGVWTSNQLISFDSYGAAPNALRQRGIVAGVPGFRPNLSPMSFNPVPIGGLAVFRIRLLRRTTWLWIPMPSQTPRRPSLRNSPRRSKDLPRKEHSRARSKMKACMLLATSFVFRNFQRVRP